MIQEVIVGIIVTVAVISVIVHFTPRTFRRMLAFRMANMARRCKWTWLERKLIVRHLTQAPDASQCGACNGCSLPSQQQEICSSITPETLRRTAKR